MNLFAVLSSSLSLQDHFLPSPPTPSPARATPQSSSARSLPQLVHLNLPSSLPLLANRKKPALFSLDFSPPMFPSSLPLGLTTLLVSSLLAGTASAIGDFACKGANSQSCLLWSTDTQAQGPISASAICQPGESFLPLSCRRRGRAVQGGTCMLTDVLRPSKRSRKRHHELLWLRKSSLHVGCRLRLWFIHSRFASPRAS